MSEVPRAHGVLRGMPLKGSEWHRELFFCVLLVLLASCTSVDKNNLSQLFTNITVALRTKRKKKSSCLAAMCFGSVPGPMEAPLRAGFCSFTLEDGLISQLSSY